VTGGIFLGGYGQKLQDTRIDLKITQKARGLTVRQGSLLPPLVRNEQREGRGIQGLWAFQSSGLRAPRGSDEMQNGERRSRGSRWCAHQRGRRTGGGWILDGGGWLTGGQQLGTTKLPATWASMDTGEVRGR
jgi:hypothetical protein